MKKNLFALMMAVMAIMAFSLTSCSSGADAKVNEFVKQLNSDTFKEQAVASKVFTDTDAKVEGNDLILTFKTIPGLSFKGADQSVLDTQKAAMVAQFKTALGTDKIFREGFEGMKEKGMTFVMKFEDTQGESVAINITPAEVLD